MGQALRDEALLQFMLSKSKQYSSTETPERGSSSMDTSQAAHVSDLLHPDERDAVARAQLLHGLGIARVPWVHAQGLHVRGQAHRPVHLG